MNVLVIAAHPDDEVLGMGGTIKKLSKKNYKIHLCVVSEGASAQYKNKNMILIRKNACIKACKMLGVTGFSFLDFPDARLDSVSQLDINIKLEEIISKIKPISVYTTPSNDLSKDHQLVFESTLVATRPHSSHVENVFSYEIPGIVKKPFLPTVYEDITKEFHYKVRAFKIYKSEVTKFPHPRSIKAIEGLASLRAMESGLLRAEAFQLIRSIIR